MGTLSAPIASFPNNEGKLKGHHHLKEQLWVGSPVPQEKELPMASPDPANALFIRAKAEGLLQICLGQLPFCNSIPLDVEKEPLSLCRAHSLAD